MSRFNKKQEANARQLEFAFVGGKMTVRKKAKRFFGPTVQLDSKLVGETNRRTDRFYFRKNPDPTMPPIFTWQAFDFKKRSQKKRRKLARQLGA